MALAKLRSRGHAYVNASYGAIRPRLMALKESIAGTTEKILGVRVQSIVQELEAVLLPADEAEALAASEGGPLLISRSVYPHGRLVYRTELRRGEPPADQSQA